MKGLTFSGPLGYSFVAVQQASMRLGASIRGIGGNECSRTVLVVATFCYCRRNV